MSRHASNSPGWQQAAAWPAGSRDGSGGQACQAEDLQATDAGLIGRSLRDPRWFAAIFDRHADAIVRYASARLGPDMAEDVTAETFLAAFRRRDHYDMSRPDAGPWLYGIAARQIGRHRRDEARQVRMLGSVPVQSIADDFSSRSAEQVTAEQLRPQLARVLAGMPRRDRDLLLLIAWADLSYAEAAQALGTTVGAVRSRLNRIRVRARRKLGGTNPANFERDTSRG